MTKTTESVLFLISPPMQACYSLSSAPTGYGVTTSLIRKYKNETNFGKF